MSGALLGSMKIIEKKKVVTLEQDIQTTFRLSELLEDFPPIPREDPPDVLAHFITHYYHDTGISITWDMIP